MPLRERLASHPTLRGQYVSAQDISKVVIRRYTGWWDRLPSHRAPVPWETEVAAIAALAGGPPAVVAAARAELRRDVRLACRLADSTWLAAPEDPDVQQRVIDSCLARILDSRSDTQEMLVGLDATTAARRRQLESRP